MKKTKAFQIKVDNNEVKTRRHIAPPTKIHKDKRINDVDYPLDQLVRCDSCGIKLPNSELNTIDTETFRGMHQTLEVCDNCNIRWQSVGLGKIINLDIWLDGVDDI